MNMLPKMTPVQTIPLFFFSQHFWKVGVFPTCRHQTARVRPKKTSNMRTKHKPKCVIAGWEKTRVGAHNAPNTLDPKGHNITNNSSVFPGWFVQQFRCLGWVVFKHLTGTQNNTQGVFLQTLRSQSKKIELNSGTTVLDKTCSTAGITLSNRCNKNTKHKWTQGQQPLAV